MKHQIDAIEQFPDAQLYRLEIEIVRFDNS